MFTYTDVSVYFLLYAIDNRDISKKYYHSIQFMLACQENIVLLALGFYRLKNPSFHYSSELFICFRSRVLKMTVERNDFFPGSILQTRCPMFTADCKLYVECI